MSSATQRAVADEPGTDPPPTENSHDTPDEALIDSGALSALVAPVRARLLLGMAMSALSAVAALVPFVAIAEVGHLLLTDDPDTGRVWLWALTGVVAVVTRSLLYGGSLMLCHLADADFRYQVRVRITRRLGGLPLGWFADHGSGQVKKMVTDDVSRMHVIVAHLAADLTSALVAPFAALVYLFVVDWAFALALLGYIVVSIAAVAPALQRGYAAHMDEYNHAQGALGSAAVELVDGIEVVKTFGRGNSIFTRFSDAVQRLVTVAHTWMSATGRPVNVMSMLFFPGTMTVVITAMGLGFARAGWIEPIDLLPFLLVGIGIPTGYLTVGQLANSLREARLAATHVGRVLREPGLPEPTRPRTPSTPDIEFDDVSFGYRSGDDVLRELGFTLRPGTVTALVGPSGSGKTTVARLIPRFWDVTAGTVRIGGIDVREIPSAQLLSRIAIVFQDAVMLQASVRDNIAVAHPHATHEQIVAAARSAQIHDRIMELPQQYDTVLGSAGAHLSGGERQRLTIARAFVQDAAIIVLDEATAHADPHSEVLVQRALAQLSVGRTVLVIAHRLHSIRTADQILVLDAGRVAQRGTHDQLLTAGGRYARLWHAQQSPSEPVESEAAQ